MRIMVAPNGASLTQADHPALPVTIAQTVDCAAACFAAGADALHAHVRDEAGRHSLDAGRYRELLDEMARSVPDMPVQITTELGGLYTAETQRRLTFDLMPDRASVALREQLCDDDLPAARVMYFGARDQGTKVQHILYTPAEVARLEQLQDQGVVPPGHPQVLFVLGRYGDGPASTPGMIGRFLAAATRPLDWMVAAFGQAETDCLVSAARNGGAMRVGFENNRLHPDGTLAASNADRVAVLFRALKQLEPRAAVAGG